MSTGGGVLAEGVECWLRVGCRLRGGVSTGGGVSAEGVECWLRVGCRLRGGVLAEGLGCRLRGWSVG